MNSANVAASPRRQHWHNYLCHILDGGIFIGALNIANANTLLPVMIKSLGGPPWLISLMPVAMMVGFLIPPVLTAHHIDRMRRFKPSVILTGVLQRLPFAAAGAMLIWMSGPRWLLLAAAALAPFLLGVVGGFTVIAWQRLVIRTVSLNRRSSMLGVRNVIACVIGIAGGWLVTWVLNTWPGAVGYGILYLVAFGLLDISFVFFFLIREPAPLEPPHDGPHHTLMENLRLMPRLVATDRTLRTFILTNAFKNGLFVLTPFLAIYAQLVTGRPESYVGELQVMQMIGAVVGNIIASYLGDRMGARPAMVLGRVLFLIVAAAALVARTDLAFRGIFLLFGFAFYTIDVATLATTLELCPSHRSATWLSVVSVSNLPSMLAATAAAGLLWAGPESFVRISAVTMGCLAVSTWFLLRLRPPYRNTPQPSPAKP